MHARAHTQIMVKRIASVQRIGRKKKMPWDRVRKALLGRGTDFD